MSELIHKISQLKDLQRLKAETEEETKSAAKRPERTTVASFESEPTTAMPKAKPLKTQPCDNGNDSMPRSLEGLSALDLSLLEVDGMLTPVEQVWLNKRRNRSKDRQTWNPGPHDWMK